MDCSEPTLDALSEELIEEDDELREEEELCDSLVEELEASEDTELELEMLDSELEEPEGGSG